MNKMPILSVRRTPSGRIETVKAGSRVSIGERATKTLNGSGLIVRVSMTNKEIIRETGKQLKSMVETPISEARRAKATALSSKATAAKDSAVTAKFRRVAECFRNAASLALSRLMSLLASWWIGSQRSGVRALR